MERVRSKKELHVLILKDVKNVRANRDAGQRGLDELASIKLLLKPRLMSQVYHWRSVKDMSSRDWFSTADSDLSSSQRLNGVRYKQLAHITQKRISPTIRPYPT